MIKNPKLLKRFEDNYARKTGRLSYKQAMQIFVHLWIEAQKLGLFPPKKPLEGIESDLKIAKILNSCLKKSSQK